MGGDAVLTINERSGHGLVPRTLRDRQVFIGRGGDRSASFLILLVLAALCLAGCLGGKTGDEPWQNAAGDGPRLSVVVTLLPQEEVARAVGGERVFITVVVPPGVEPHTYEPSAAQIVQISRADLYLRLGPGLLPFEDALVDRLKTLNPGMRIVDTSRGVSPITMPGQGHDTAKGVDPHVWLSLAHLRLMAGNMADAFIAADPAHEEAYAASRDEYIARVEDTDRRIRGLLLGMEGKPFLVFHPAWGYFAREYGLVQVAVGEDGREPGARGLSSLIARAREEGIRVVFAEPQYDTRGSEVVAREIGGRVVLIDPLAPDTLANLERVASEISESYGGMKEEGENRDPGH